MTDRKMREETGDMIKKFYFNDRTIDLSAEMEFTDVNKFCIYILYL